MAVPCAGDIKKAKDAGYHTCQGLMMHTKKVVFSGMQNIVHPDLVCMRSGVGC